MHVAAPVARILFIYLLVLELFGPWIDVCKTVVVNCDRNKVFGVKSLEIILN